MAQAGSFPPVPTAEIPEPVRRQALHPFRELPTPPGWRKVDRGRFLVVLHPLPFAQIVEPGELSEEEVAAAVEEARTLVREHGRSLLFWLLGPEHRRLGASLEALGLVNTDTPGFEQTENAMARQQTIGLAPVLLVQHALRPMLSRFLRRSLPQLKVLSYAEVPDTRNVKVVNVVGGG